MKTKKIMATVFSLTIVVCAFENMAKADPFVVTLERNNDQTIAYLPGKDGATLVVSAESSVIISGQNKNPRNPFPTLTNIEGSSGNTYEGLKTFSLPDVTGKTLLINSGARQFSVAPKGQKNGQVKPVKIQAITLNERPVAEGASPKTTVRDLE